MNIFEMLDRESKQRGLPFLIIGGHAVNAYGYSRFTKDLDILIRREQRSEWFAVLEQNGFSLKRDAGSFVQFNAPAGCKWPLDLMLVNERTFSNITRDSQEMEISQWKFRLPSLDGLFALKFHALKHHVRERGYKDLVDVLELARCNDVDVRSERMKSICEKYGSPKIYEEVIAFGS